MSSAARETEKPPVRLTEMTGLDALWPRKTEWNALVERSETNTIFQTFEWHASWWKALRGKARPLILLAEVAGEMVGIAPLMLSEHRVLGRKRRIVEFIGARSSDYCDFIVDRTQSAALPLMLQWLLENDQQWDMLCLADIPETSSLLRFLPDFFDPCGYRTDVRGLYQAHARVFGDDPNADQQLVKKKSLRRHYNYFCKHGQLEFKNYTSVEESMDYLECLFQQHIHR